MLYFHRQGEVGERAEGFGFRIAEVLHQIAEDEFQRVIALWAGAEEVERIGEGEAVATPKLASSPAQQQRLAAGLAVEDMALGVAGLCQELIVCGEFGESVERGLLAEFFQDEFLSPGADAPAAGEDGFAAGG